MSLTAFVCHVKTGKHFTIDKGDLLADQKLDEPLRKYKVVDQKSFVAVRDRQKKIAECLQFLVNEKVLKQEDAEKLFPVPGEKIDAAIVDPESSANPDGSVPKRPGRPRANG